MVNQYINKPTNIYGNNQFRVILLDIINDKAYYNDTDRIYDIKTITNLTQSTSTYTISFSIDNTTMSKHERCLLYEDQTAYA